MVIPPIDEGDAHRHFGEGLRRGEPCEAGADNDNMRVWADGGAPAPVELLQHSL